MNQADERGFVASKGLMWCGICALLAIATALTVLSVVGGA